MAMATPKVHRRSARRRALQFVFSMNFRTFEDKKQVQRAFFELPVDDEDWGNETVAAVSDSTPLTLEDREFAAKLATGVYLFREEIDQVIQRFSKHWRIARIAKAELSILRLSVYEMLHEPDIPLRVSINEAVELSKAFADDHSFPFVNGILDAVAKAVSHGEFGLHKQF
ncbi:transcription antitermination factor NusB [Desulfonatronum parangueonense]